MFPHRKLSRTSRLIRWRYREVLTRGCDRGMSTAEYAIGTLAACGFAATLVVIMRSDAVRDLLLAKITQALSLGG